MNQSHWNDNNDQNQNDCTEYTSSTQYPPREYIQAQQASANSSAPRKSRGGRIALIAAITTLCLSLCFVAGVIGTLVANSFYDGSGQHTASDADGGSSGTLPGFDTENSGLGKDANVTYADNANRNPLPELNKQPSLGTVTYSGSAGDKAYTTLAQAYEKVADTVVEISTETVVNGGFLGNYVSSGAGSGVIISDDGYIVTNHHVISGADTVTVRLKDGDSYEALVVGTDEASDIAVLWIDSQQPLPAATLGCSADLIVGEYVFAIGNPLGSLGGTLTDGIISATARQINIGGSPMTLLQTNAAVNPGNSGGGLFNMAGQLIGVVNAKCSQDDVEGLGFAIPIDTAYDVICQLIEYGYVRGVVDSGLTLYDASSTLAAWKNFGSMRLGAYIVESKYSDELRFGDYLLSMNGVSITQTADAEQVLATCAVGDTVTVEVIRLEARTKNGRTEMVETTRTVQLTLREYVPADIDVSFNN